MPEKTEQAWQRVKDAHDTMMQAYQDYLTIAQEEDVLPKIGHIYKQGKEYTNAHRNIVILAFETRFCLPDASPFVQYRTINKDGSQGRNIYRRSSIGLAVQSEGEYKP
jgi:hypothetical protein